MDRLNVERACTGTARTLLQRPSSIVLRCDMTEGLIDAKQGRLVACRTAACPPARVAMRRGRWLVGKESTVEELVREGPVKAREEMEGDGNKCQVVADGSVDGVGETVRLAIPLLQRHARREVCGHEDAGGERP